MKYALSLVPGTRLKLIMAGVAVLLLLPLVAMLFTNEVSWTGSDFIVAAALLFGTGLLCEAALRMIRQVKYRVAVCVALLLVSALVWLELAVGIFGTGIAGS